MSTKTTTPRVSIVMATYNMGQFLPFAVQSVLNQTCSDLELTIVDDGSTDQTRQILAPFLVDPRVYYHYQANAGQTVAKNVGIRASRGEYVGFCDADDSFAPTKLEQQIPILDADPKIAVCYTRVRPMDIHGELMAPVRLPEYSGSVTRELYFENFIPFGTALVRRKTLQSVGGFDESRRMGIDWDLWLRLSVQHQFAFLPSETYFYRVWPGQMSKNWQGRYDSAFQIMKDFDAANPGLIDPATRRRALAQSYLNRARTRAMLSADRLGALADSRRAYSQGASLYAAARCALSVLFKRNTA